MVLDVVWLVRTFGSTWAYAFLDARPRTCLYHVVLCSGRWRWLRCMIVSLDPSNLILRQDPGSYRRWSGKIGRYNLLDECTRAPAGCKTGLWSRLLARVESMEPRYLSPLPPNVKNMLFQRIRQRLPRSDSPPGKLHGDPYTMKDITTLWGQEAVDRHVIDADDRPPFGHEFQEDILVWHIGTSIFLACANQQFTTPGDYGKYAKAIEALSEYLMFLLAMRRHMLPGLVLSSLFEVTRDALGELWIKSDEKCYSSGSRARKVKLAEILHKEKSNNDYLYWGRGNEKKRLISDGAELAILLLDVGRSNMQELLELLFDVWVDKLLYAGTRCSRESHTKQLGRGGELTTIVWILTEHASPFQIGEFTDEIKFLSAPPLSKEKQSGEKKDGVVEKEPEPPKKEKPTKPPPHKKEPWWSPPPKAKKPEDKKPEEKKPEKPYMEKMKPDSPPFKPEPKEERKPDFEPKRKRRFATLYPPK
ncbi:hypothetical protein PR202_gb06543 [Eleusine coracana subsp. coracana]|uniref:DUF4220 domain-containing protein n=1 Tax=Eleusine coracana subsp. coracana TaxID=191504 RepID=A0AAV5EAK4_ELECO|nr:hypothetical protein PR202_gb06543 [Eleusine coracana subsp. coracana]